MVKYINNDASELDDIDGPAIDTTQLSSKYLHNICSPNDQISIIYREIM